MIPLSARSQIAIVKKDALYVLACDQAGRPPEGTKAIKVFNLWPTYGWDRIGIQWTPGRRMAVTHDVKPWNGPRRFGISQKSPVTSIGLVDAKRHANLQPMTEGSDPCFTPDGKSMLFDTDDLEGDLWTFSLSEHLKKLLTKKATRPVLSKDSKLVAFVRETHPQSFAQPVEIRSFPMWSLVKVVPPSASPIDLKF